MYHWRVLVRIEWIYHIILRTHSPFGWFLGPAFQAAVAKIIREGGGIGRARVKNLRIEARLRWYSCDNCDNSFGANWHLSWVIAVMFMGESSNRQSEVVTRHWQPKLHRQSDKARMHVDAAVNWWIAAPSRVTCGLLHITAKDYQTPH